MRTRRKILVGALVLTIAATPVALIGIANAGTTTTSIPATGVEAPPEDPPIYEPANPAAPPAPATHAPSPGALQQSLTAQLQKQYGTSSNCPTSTKGAEVRCVRVRRVAPKDREKAPPGAHVSPSSVKGGLSEGERERQLTTNSFIIENTQAQDIPNWCWDPTHDLGQWFQNRLDACQYDEYWIEIVVQVGNKEEVVGSEKVLQTTWVKPANRAPSPRYDHNVEIFIPPASQTGQAGWIPQQIEVHPSCYHCQAHDINPGHMLSITADNFYVSRYRNVVPLAMGQQSDSLSWQFMSYIFPGYLPLADVMTNSPLIRCDRIVLSTPGCIIKSGNGWFSVDLHRAKSAEWAQHVWDAEKGLRDHWGWYSHGRILTRLTDKAARRRNNRVACQPPPSGQKPGQSCDEYPFASTHEGAGIVGRNRTSSKNINAKHNSSGGGLTSAFYQSQRILEGDPFWVSIFAS